MSTTGLIVRWLARFFSAIIALIILIIFIGEMAGSESLTPPGLSFSKIVMGLLFLITWLGFIVGWKKEKPGGWMIILGMTAFYAVQYLNSGSVPSGLFYLYMLIPGILYLVSEHMNREADASEESSAPLQDV